MYTLSEAHPLTMLIVVAAFLVTPLHLLASFAFSGASLRIGFRLAFLWLLAGAAMFYVCIANVEQDLGLLGNLLVPLAWFTPSVLLLIFREKVLAHPLSSKWLISLQIWRAIGVVFLIEMYRGNLPGIFAYPAGVGDVTVALIALVVIIAYRSAEKIPTKAIHLVGVCGMIDFMGAFFFGFFSSETPLQLFSFDNPNNVTLFPTGMIPLFLVPYAIFFHVLAWLNLAKFGETQ
ncbi:MAG: hypothetical protein AAGB06_05725 [Verrucomicrobiota bacterium]